MDQLKHEIKGEKVSNTLRMETKLRSMLHEMEGLSSGGSADQFNALRSKVLALRQELVIQREMSGFPGDNAREVEGMWPVPPPMKT